MKNIISLVVLMSSLLIAQTSDTMDILRKESFGHPFEKSLTELKQRSALSSQLSASNIQHPASSIQYPEKESGTCNFIFNAASGNGRTLCKPL
jgi:hypothetical protein